MATPQKAGPATGCVPGYYALSLEAGWRMGAGPDHRAPGCVERRRTRQADAAHQRELRQQALTAYLDQLRQELALTEIVPIPNAYATIDTRDYTPLWVAAPGSHASEPVFAALTAQPAPKGLLIVGSAGSGKSHTLRYTALLLAEARQTMSPATESVLGLPTAAALVPIYVRLQDIPACRNALQQAEPGSEPSLLRSIDRHLRRRPAVAAEMPQADLVAALIAAAEERCLFLFDGLDEIDDPLECQRVQEQLAGLQRQYPQHMYVVTTRPLANHQLSAAGFAERQLLPLRREQQYAILKQWYRQEYDTIPQPEEAAQIEHRARALLEHIQADPDLQPMAVVPLFLTAMARMQIALVGLPTSRVKTYDRIIDLLLEWRRNRMRLADMHAVFGGDHRDALAELQRLAACMLITGRRDLTLEAYVSGVCLDHLPTRNAEDDPPDATDIEQLLRSLVRHTGLLTEQADCYTFTFGFRDYLAACFIARSQPDMQELAARANDPAWHAAIIMMVGYWTHVLLYQDLPVELAAALHAAGPAGILLAAAALREAFAEGMVRNLAPAVRSTIRELHALEGQPEYADRAAALRQELEQLLGGTV
jgi:predicted NACHT family NTPase